jgi:hypothetical protein
MMKQVDWKKLKLGMIGVRGLHGPEIDRCWGKGVIMDKIQAEPVVGQLCGTHTQGQY